MKEIKVFAPASVANLACGFDVLGLAIEKPGDVIVARRSEVPGLRITRITGDGGKLPTDIDLNTAGFAAKQLLQSTGNQEQGVDLEIHKRMPFGSGLGSSAASAAGAVFAVSKLLGLELTKQELLPYAVLGEQQADGAYHADNVAPSLMGGIVLIRDNASLDIIQLPVPDDLFVSVVHPQIEILTKEARNILSGQVSLASHIRQSGNLAALVSSLYTSDYELLSRSLNDHIIESQRKKLLPWFDELKCNLKQARSLGSSISGSGPSIFALSRNETNAMQIHEVMESFFSNKNITHEVYTSKVNVDGVKVI